jgi:hypothetical protein
MESKNTRCRCEVRIGTSPAGVEWVAYRPDNVEPMRQRLENLWLRVVRKLTRVPQTVIEEAYDCAHLGAEAGIDYCASVEVGDTVIKAAPIFFDDLAGRLEIVAWEYENGERTTDDADPNRAFVESRDQRLATCLRKWARRCMRIARRGED